MFCLMHRDTQTGEVRPCEVEGDICYESSLRKDVMEVRSWEINKEAKEQGWPSEYFVAPMPAGLRMPPLQFPETITVDYQPYDRVTLRNLKEIAPGHVTAEVVGGTQTSYLGGHRSTQAYPWKTYTLYGVSQHELDSGHIVRVAM